MARSPPPTMGAVSISELPPWSSPRAETEMVTRPFLTRVVGTSTPAEAVVMRTTRMVPQASAATTATAAANTSRRVFISSGPFPTSTKVTFDPAGMPETATSSGLRACTWTSTGPVGAVRGEINDRLAVMGE